MGRLCLNMDHRSTLDLDSPAFPCSSSSSSLDLHSRRTLMSFSPCSLVTLFLASPDTVFLIQRRRLLRRWRRLHYSKGALPRIVMRITKIAHLGTKQCM